MSKAELHTALSPAFLLAGAVYCPLYILFLSFSFFLLDRLNTRSALV